VAHFFYKKEEIKSLVKSWASEAEELAVYEAYLCRRAELAKAAVSGALEAERKASEAAHNSTQAAIYQLALQTSAAAVAAAAAAAASGGGGKKASKAKAKYSAPPRRPPPHVFIPSSSLKRGIEKAAPFITAYSKWIQDTDVRSHQVFSTRLAVPTSGPSHSRVLQACTSALEASKLTQAVTSELNGLEAGWLGAVAAAGATPWSPTASLTGSSFSGSSLSSSMYGGSYMGVQPGSPSLTVVSTDINALKVSQPCTAFSLAVATLEASDSLCKELEGLTQKILDAAED